ncbi:MAG: polysaccharide biosynthesis tyrosine autokinase [Actinomycetota bacterium]
MRSIDPPPEYELSLSDYLVILRRRWQWAVAMSALIAAAAGAFIVVRTPVYETTALVALGNSAAQDVVTNSGFTNVQFASRELSNEVNAALSDVVRTEVESRLGLEPDITVTADEASDVLRFTSQSTIAADATLASNTWAEVYVEAKRQEAVASITDAVLAFETDLADLREQRRDLVAPVAAIENRLAAAPTDARRTQLEAELARTTTELQPEMTLLDSRVQAIAESITNLELQGRLASTGTARVVQVASSPQEPANEPAARVLVAAAIVGLAAGVAAALLAEALDQTIRSVDDLAHLAVPVLGGIPAPGRELDERDLPLATMRYTGTAVAEGYQKVRTALEFSLLGRQINSLLITSPNESEGKTTLSVNLAWALSAVDHRVALADVDFRKPRIHQIFDCAAVPGLSDHILHDMPLAQAALRVDEHGSRNLIVVPTGTAPPSPADFVATPRFTQLIDAVEQEADLVVLDAPPVLPVSDAPSIGRQVDAVIVVVRAGSTSKRALEQALTSLRVVGADVIGLCVVGIKATGSPYGYRDGEHPDEAPERRSWFRRRKASTVDLRETPTPAEPPAVPPQTSQPAAAVPTPQPESAAEPDDLVVGSHYRDDQAAY